MQKSLTLKLLKHNLQSCLNQIIFYSTTFANNLDQIILALLYLQVILIDRYTNYNKINNQSTRNQTRWKTDPIKPLYYKEQIISNKMNANPRVQQQQPYVFQQKDEPFPEPNPQKPVGKILSKYQRQDINQQPAKGSSRLRQAILINYSQIYNDIRMPKLQQSKQFSPRKQQQQHNNQVNSKDYHQFSSAVQLKNKKTYLNNSPNRQSQQQQYEQADVPIKRNETAIQFDKSMKEGLVVNSPNKNYKTKIFSGGSGDYYDAKGNRQNQKQGLKLKYDYEQVLDEQQEFNLPQQRNIREQNYLNPIQPQHSQPFRSPIISDQNSKYNLTRKHIRQMQRIQAQELRIILKQKEEEKLKVQQNSKHKYHERSRQKEYTQSYGLQDHDIVVHYEQNSQKQINDEEYGLQQSQQFLQKGQHEQQTNRISKSSYSKRAIVQLENRQNLKENQSNVNDIKGQNAKFNLIKKQQSNQLQKQHIGIAKHLVKDKNDNNVNQNKNVRIKQQNQIKNQFVNQKQQSLREDHQVNISRGQQSNGTLDELQAEMQKHTQANSNNKKMYKSRDIQRNINRSKVTKHQKQQQARKNQYQQERRQTKTKLKQNPQKNDFELAEAQQLQINFEQEVISHQSKQQISSKNSKKPEYEDLVRGFDLEEYTKVYPVLKSMQTAMKAQVIDAQSLVRGIKRYLQLIAGGCLDNIDGFDLQLHKKKIVKTALLYERIAIIVIAFSYANNLLKESHKYLLNLLSYTLGTSLLMVKVLDETQIINPLIASRSNNQVIRKSDRLMLKKSIDTIRNNNDVLIDSIFKLSKYDNLFYENLKQIVKALHNSSLPQTFYNVLEYFAFFLCVSDLHQMLPFLAVTPDPYLPPCLTRRYTLVIDIVEVLCQGTKKAKFHTFRPYAEHFLAQMNNYFEIVAFTNSLPNQVDKLISLLDQKGYIKHRLYKHHGIHKIGHWAKDLQRLGRPMNRVILLDNENGCGKQAIQNTIHIPQWRGTKKDSILAQMCPVLAMIAIKQIQAQQACKKIRDQTHRNQKQGVKYVNFGISFD